MSAKEKNHQHQGFVVAVFLLLFLCRGGVLGADQFVWVPQQAAERAASILERGSIVRHFCEPCGDTTWREEEVSKVQTKESEWDDDSFEIILNGTAIDLAYTYIETDGGWLNLALMLDLDASDVSRKLDGEVYREEVGINDPCESPRSTHEALQCAQAEFDAADAELNRVYAEAMKILDEPRRSRLRDAQRAWLPYRDACAEFEASLFEGGTMAPVLRISEKADLTRKRTEELREIIELGE